ncbi:hypothetical protein JCM6882_000823 [Rhodosporidiobolus microsporus]
MTEKPKEPCWICGELTTTRCGACEKAGIDIFFCSREHQKLVWPVHKLVCGPGKANPFLWPALSKEELTRMLKNLDEPYVIRGDTVYQTTLRQWLGVLGDEKSLSELASLSSDLTQPDRQEQLVKVRAAEHFRWTGSRGLLTESVEAFVPRHAVDYGSALLYTFLDPDTLPYQPLYSWWSPTHHRILFSSFLTLLSRRRRDGGQLGAFKQHALTAAQREVRGGLALVDASAGADLVSELGYGAQRLL